MEQTFSIWSRYHATRSQVIFLSFSTFAVLLRKYKSHKLHFGTATEPPGRGSAGSGGIDMTEVKPVRSQQITYKLPTDAQCLHVHMYDHLLGSGDI